LSPPDPKAAIQIALAAHSAWLKGADTVEKLTNHARFTFLEDDSYCSFRVIGSVVTANYGWRLKK